MRFYLARTGTITIDGSDILDLDSTWLRNNITLVQQQSILFNETIFTNVALGSQEPGRVTVSQVDICLHLASLDGMIASLPNGLGTMVGSRGSELSGGQRQRVAIARARLRDTPVLILDEATSALDAPNRNAVMESIRRWRKGRTTIIITHDLAQIREKDLVYMMDAGRIVCRGSLSTIRHAQHTLHADGPGLHTQPYPHRGKVAKVTASILPRGLGPSNLSSRAPASAEADSRHAVRQSGRSGGRISMVLSLRSDPAFQRLKRQSLSRARAMYSAERARELVDKAPGLPSPVAGDHKVTDLSSPYGSNGSCNGTLRVVGSAIELQNVARKEDGGTVSETIHDDKSVQDSTQTILQMVWPILDTTHQVKIVIGLAAALIHAGCTPAFSYAIIQLFGTFGIYSGYHTKVLTYSLAIVGVAVIDGIACASMQYLLGSVSQAWVDTLREMAVKRILQQPKGWFDEETNKSSIIVSSLDRHAEGARVLVDHFAPQVLVVSVMMAVTLAWSLNTCWKLALVSLAGIPFIYAVVKLLDVISSRWSSRTNSAVEKLLDVFIESFSDIRTVRALTLESFFHQKYSQTLQVAFEIGTRRAIFTGFCYGLSESVITLFTPMIFWYGVHLAKTREWSAMDILTVFSLLLFTTASASAIMAYVPRASSATEYATQLLELSRMPVHSHENAGQLRLDRSKLNRSGVAIQFTNQTFFYPTHSETSALRHLNLIIPRGKCTVIVGSSGSGKSTITSLILGLYPPAAKEAATTLAGDTHDSVSLRLFGCDIRTLEISTLRSLVAMVPQTPFLLPTTVRENIIYGLGPGSSLASATCIESAARSAGIHEFIQSLPQGYATIIGEAGLGVSGGQAQRIVIARALVRDPKILILDEATSALDRESADTVRTSIMGLVRRKQSTMTVIVITHAREMMTFADQVVVMENGTAVEEGPYRDLIRKKGKLWDMLQVDQLQVDQQLERALRHS
ncbi:uncharacterized protein PV06_06141 [Exophiala oligosperma]|uniref:ABC transporter domain-containing protein n=1 Tax=Exophiala oligosperma TaxID=215243 RepID=A0A0D2E494_9EURO|nr:uncharacterized protein PV06_06141 [Exophiala oligosperma]KIW42609.1 hypothetical protein PV06_06141 [Exophiala oligosperma]